MARLFGCCRESMPKLYPPPSGLLPKSRYCIKIQSVLQHGGTAMTEDLTEKQQEILDFIRETIEKTGFPPTRAEIAKAFRYSSPNAAEDHLRTLERKGAIEIVAGTSRGIRLAEGS